MMDIPADRPAGHQEEAARDEQETKGTTTDLPGTFVPDARTGTLAHGALPGIHQYGQCALIRLGC